MARAGPGRVPLNQHVDVSDVEAAVPARPAKGRKILIVSLVSVVGLVALAGVVWQWIVPAIAQGNIDGSVITLESAVMSKPTVNGLHLQSTVVLDKAGLIGATMHSFEASMSYNGKVFGTLDFPEVKINGGAKTTVVLDSDLRVTDEQVFRAATSVIMQGNSVDWQVIGKPSVTAVGRTMTLNMNKKLSLPGLPLEGLSVTNVDILSGTNTTLHCSGDNFFTSNSAVEIENFGPQSFLVYTAPSANNPQGVLLGRCTMPNFQVTKGYNSIKDVQIFLEKTTESVSEIAKFVSYTAAGIDQEVMIFGPIDSPYPFLNNVTTQKATAKGLPTGMAVNATISQDSLVLGYDPWTGQHCAAENLTCMQTVMHGPLQLLANYMNAEMTITNMNVNVFSKFNLKYNVSVEIVIGSTVFNFNETCAQGNMMANLHAMPGMWSPLNLSRANDADIVLDPKPNNQAAGFTTSFLPGRPQIGQSQVDPSMCSQAVELIFPYDCCFLSIFTAAVCHYQKLGMNYFPVDLQGNATLAVGNFTLDLQVIQKDVPTFFTPDMTFVNFYNLSKFSCADITFAPDS